MDRKETVFKKRPPCIVFEKQEGELKRIGFVKIVPKLSVNRVLKEMTIPFTSYSINNTVGELLIQVLLNDHY